LRGFYSRKEKRLEEGGKVRHKRQKESEVLQFREIWGGGGSHKGNVKPRLFLKDAEENEESVSEANTQRMTNAPVLKKRGLF